MMTYCEAAHGAVPNRPQRLISPITSTFSWSPYNECNVIEVYYRTCIEGFCADCFQAKHPDRFPHGFTINHGSAYILFKPGCICVRGAC